MHLAQYNLGRIKGWTLTAFAKQLNVNPELWAYVFERGELFKALVIKYAAHPTSSRNLKTPVWYETLTHPTVEQAMLDASEFCKNKLSSKA